jgi:hypothetical protein
MRFETLSSVLVILFVAIMFFGCRDELNPKYRLDHVAFEIPVRMTDASKTFFFSFSTTYRSRRYQFLFSFMPESKQRPSALSQCLSNAQFVLTDGTTKIDSGDLGSEIEHSTFRGRVFIGVTGDLTLSPGVDYTFETTLPEFSPECNSLDPVLILSLGPAPSL